MLHAEFERDKKELPSPAPRLFETPLQSVVLDEVKNLSLQGILLLHAEVVPVPAHCSPEC